MADTKPIAPGDHQAFMLLALSLAQQSPRKPSNFRVGAILVDERRNEILSTGFTLELPGNTHAEQCCLSKFAASKNVSEDGIADLLPEHTVIYTTMEPCVKRLSGNIPCVERILQTRNGASGGIRTVYLGVQEPDTFVESNTGRTKLEEAGIKCVHVPGLEDEILSTATAGHDVKEG